MNHDVFTTPALEREVVSLEDSQKGAMAVIHRCLTPAMLIAVMLVAGCSSNGGAYQSWARYGNSQAVYQGEPTALRALDQSQACSVFVAGSVASVHPADGWMMIADGDRQARVKFTGVKFDIPQAASGQRVVVQGWGQPVLLDVPWARQLAEESGASRAEIDAITQPVPTYEIDADVVYVQGSGSK